MSAAQRSIARLPLAVFDVKEKDDNTEAADVEVLRSEIGNKLKAVTQIKDAMLTVGSLLQLSPAMLLRALDPLLTYGTKNFKSRFSSNNF
jgi:hypothetical protein